MTDPSVKTYCITFGVIGVNLNALAQYLFDSVDILAFWNYVPLFYCVKSRLSATELTFKMQSFFPNGGFMIAELNPLNMNGVLPEEAWRWFYLEHHEKTRAPALPYVTGLLPYLPSKR